MAASDHFEDICPRCLEPHMIDGDTPVGSLCPQCQSLSFYGVPVNQALAAIQAWPAGTTCDVCGSKKVYQAEAYGTIGYRCDDCGTATYPDGIPEVTPCQK